MRTSKLLAYLFLVAGVAVSILAIDVALTPLFPGPYVMGPLDGYPVWVRQTVPGCTAILLLMFAMVLGTIGAVLWRVGARESKLAEKHIESAAGQETEIQALLDSQVSALTQAGASLPSSEEVRALAARLAPSLQERLYRFFTACDPAYPQPAAVASSPQEKPAGRAANLAAYALTAVGLLASLYFGMFFLILLQDPMFSLMAECFRRFGIEIGQTEALLSGAGCFGISLVLLLGGIGLFLLLRREGKRQRSRLDLRDRVRNLCLEGWSRRISNLVGETPPRLLRACLVSALADLDPPGRWELFSRLAEQGLLVRLPLQKLDLRGTNFYGINLSDVSLAETNLAGCVLQRTKLVQADLQGSNLMGADLRDVDATGAHLQRAALRNARLHRSSLRQADLREADLEGAALWDTDLTGADLSGARVTTRQLSEARFQPAPMEDRP
jgi:uncharacterized protein YjbI with pentapeptide repeats